MQYRKQRKKQKAQKNAYKVIWRGYFFVACFVFSSAVLFYLVSVNFLASRGAEIREAEKEIETVSEKHKKLLVQEAELKSLYQIEQIAEELDLEKPDTIDYIKENSPVAFIQE